ncbi:hypothetical protein N7527_004783 [Penicillium freii]|nr:hypothetical protein N7527_004783 [Penicillium freii]
MDFCLAQKLTRELQLVLGEDPPKPTKTSPRIKPAPDTLEAAFEWERVRRSAAPSPELLLSDGFQEVHTRTGNSEGKSGQKGNIGGSKEEDIVLIMAKR